MSLIQIRGVDDATREELMSRAVREGLSLNAFLRRLLERAVETPSREEVLARTAGRPDKSARSSTQIVRALRDERSSEPLA